MKHYNHTVFTRARHLTRSWDRWFHSSSSRLIPLRSILISCSRPTKWSLYFHIFWLNFCVYVSSLLRVIIFFNFPNLKHRWEWITVKKSPPRCGRRSSLLCRCPWVLKSGSRSAFFLMHPSRAWAVQRICFTFGIWKCVCVQIQVYFSQSTRYVIIYYLIWVTYSTIDRRHRPSYLFIYLIQRHTALYAYMLKSVWSFKSQPKLIHLGIILSCI
jgi:hypothetical protein